MSYEAYQGPLAHRLISSGKPIQALVLPTGSGKTRIALRYGAARLDDGKSVDYIVESDLHAQQVLREAEAEGIEIRFIPGRGKVRHDPDLLAQRDDDAQDYSYGEFIGLFTYAGYFHGSGISPAGVLIVDDAHALQTSEFSYSCIRLDEDRFAPATLREIRGAIIGAVPSIRPLVEQFVDPVHRGGSAVLVPPLPADGREPIDQMVRELAKTGGFDAFLLRQRLERSPHYLSWPLVVTKDTIAWHPFTLPFESLGGFGHEAHRDSELLLVTATKGPPRFLQARLGLTADVDPVEDEDVPDMGARLVLPYSSFLAGKDAEAKAAAIVEALVDRFGSVVVTTTSAAKAQALEERFITGVNTMSSKSEDERDPVERFQTLPEPRILFLINRPSGVDIPARVCNVAVHLDLPYANDGHGVLAGAGGDEGRAIDASLAVRLTQLLGRLNRSEADRSVHFVFGHQIPMEMGGLFVRTLEPGVLRDILVGQRLVRDHRTPGTDDHCDTLASFLDGDSSVQERHLTAAERMRDRLVKADVEQGYRANVSGNVESSRDLAFGNWRRAFDSFRKLMLEARDAEQGNPEAFLALQALFAMDASSAPDTDLYPPEGRKSLLTAASQASVSHPALLAALDAASQIDIETDHEHEQRNRMRHSALMQYRRLMAEDLGFPEGNDALKEDAWTSFWQEAFSQHDHDTLQEHLERALRLLGSSTPARGRGDNDIVVAWELCDDGSGLAIEVKGRKAPDGSAESHVQEGNVNQAADNAYELRDRVDVSLLFTSKGKCAKGVKQSARDREVRLVLHADAMRLAAVMGRHCAKLATIETRNLRPSELDWLIIDLHALLRETPGGESPAFSM